MKDRNYQKGTNTTLLIIVIALLLVGAFLFLKRTSNLSSLTTGTQETNQASQIQGKSDLDTTTTDLDNTNVDELDNELGQLDADSQTFAPRIRLKNGTSLNWAGYAIETNLSTPQNNAVSDVKGSWVVPSLTCTSTNTYSAAWVGIDGYSDNSVEQTGTEHDCINGKSSYYAWYEMYPKPSFRINFPVPLKAGDTISAEVQFINNKFTLTLKDVTTGQNFTTTQKSNALRQSAEWIMEAPWSGSILPLANFGTMSFSGAQATLGSATGTISNSSWQNDAITMTNSSGTPKATPSGLSGDGSSFNVTWNSN